MDLLGFNSIISFVGFVLCCSGIITIIILLIRRLFIKTIRLPKYQHRTYIICDSFNNRHKVEADRIEQGPKTIRFYYSKIDVAVFKNWKSWKEE